MGEEPPGSYSRPECLEVCLCSLWLWLSVEKALSGLRRGLLEERVDGCSRVGKVTPLLCQGVGRRVRGDTSGPRCDKRRRL